jgi:RHS repeat-associated protein
VGTVRYTVINGEVVAEKRGGVRRQYVPDPLGSTVALLDSTQTKTDTFDYWPYGEEAIRTGTTATPFQFVGTAGYYRDSATKAYVRARYLNARFGRWVTEDPIGLYGREMVLYSYVRSSPVVFVDPSGLQRQGKNPQLWPPIYGSGPTIIDPLKLPPGAAKKPPVLNPQHSQYADCPGPALCFKSVTEDVLHQMNSLFPPGTMHNGPGDAFKHCLWAGLVNLKCGPIAYHLGVMGHEMETSVSLPGYWHDLPHNWLPGEGAMDLHNNEVGRKCSLITNQASGVFSCCLSAYNNGKLWMLPPFSWN